VALPKFIGDQGILQIIAPLAAKTGQLWGSLGAFKTILYPFVEGCDGYEIALSDRQWLDIGANGAFYIVDWDNPILAPKERDLMFIGGAQGFTGHTSQEEETLFYRGYGQTPIDPIALAYYRYERIIEDIAVICEQIFLTNDGGKDREQFLKYLQSNFLPNNTIDIAYQSDRTQGIL
jgi:hypothetical protein